MQDCLLGIDLGGTRIKAVLMDQNNRILESYLWSANNIATSKIGADEWIKIINNGISEITKDREISIVSIGISTPGLTNKNHTAIAYMPGRMEELVDLNWSKVLNFKGPIPVINDAKAALMGEMNHQDFIKTKNVIMLTLGTGVGGAAIIDGKLLEGHIGRAGHFGHSTLDMEGDPSIAGMPGGMDIHIGNCHIQKRTKGLYENPKDLRDGFISENPEATKYWLKMVKSLAVGICSLINILDPEVVIIGGGIADAGESLFIPLEEYMEKYEWRPQGKKVKILKAKQGNFAGAIGAAIFGYEYSSTNSCS